MAYGGPAAARYGTNASNAPYGNSSPGAYSGDKTKPKVKTETARKDYYTFSDSEIPNIGTAKANDYVRFIFWGGASSYADNGSFYFGMKKIRNSYKEKLVFDRPMCSGQVTVKNINDQNEDSIQSLDFLCHGGPLALFFVSSKLADGTAFHTPMGLTYNFNAKYTGEKNREKYKKSFGAEKYSKLEKSINAYVLEKIQSGLYSSNLIKTLAPSYSALFEEGPDAPRKFEASLGDVEFGKFTNSAKVEIHGCRTAEDVPVFDSFCEQCSQLLYASGKERAVVIGHNAKNSPDSNNEYRHGVRLCFHDGNILFRYEDDGAISEQIIDKYLDEKEKGLLDDYYPKIKGGKETKIPR